MYDRRTVLGLSGVAVAAGVAGCGGSASEGTPTVRDGEATVGMTEDLNFDPAEIRVRSGTTVTWENRGGTPHSVTAYEDQLPDGATYFASGGFDSESAARDGWPDEGSLGESETYSHTFETTGEFQYFCIPHKGMEGTVVVVE